MEVVALLWLSPILMKFDVIRKFVTGPLGLMLVRILSMIGVASYLSQSTLLHLILISIGNFFAMLALAGSLWDKSSNDR